MRFYSVRECRDPACRFRFPMAAGDPPGERCPWCGGQTRLVCEVPAPQEETATPAVSPAPLAALLDNVRSTFNVGSIFRSADAAGFRHLYLCGVTPTPAHRKLAKTALGADEQVAWSHHRNAVDLAQELRAAGHTLWVLETGHDVLPLFGSDALPTPLVLVIGSEVTGVDPGLLALCDRAVAIPMYGYKRSLNVATAFGVAAVVLRQRLAAGF